MLSFHISGTRKIIMLGALLEQRLHTFILPSCSLQAVQSTEDWEIQVAYLVRQPLHIGDVARQMMPNLLGASSLEDGYMSR